MRPWWKFHLKYTLSNHLSGYLSGLSTYLFQEKMVTRMWKKENNLKKKKNILDTSAMEGSSVREAGFADTPLLCVNVGEESCDCDGLVLGHLKAVGHGSSSGRTRNDPKSDAPVVRVRWASSSSPPRKSASKLLGPTASSSTLLVPFLSSFYWVARGTLHRGIFFSVVYTEDVFVLVLVCFCIVIYSWK